MKSRSTAPGEERPPATCRIVEAADRLDVSSSQIYKLIGAGRLDRVARGRISVDSIAAYERSRRPAGRPPGTGSRIPRTVRVSIDAKQDVPVLLVPAPTFMPADGSAVCHADGGQTAWTVERDGAVVGVVWKCGFRRFRASGSDETFLRRGDAVRSLLTD